MTSGHQGAREETRENKKILKMLCLILKNIAKTASERVFLHLEFAFRISVVNSNIAEEGTPAE